jgi:cytoskeletal protein RodZ
MISIGQQLARARADRDLSIEDVAFHTRIPAGRLRDMESDDLSRFANLTYARGFLKLYSTYLELDISEYLEQFSSTELAHASGHEYVRMANATRNLPAAVFADYARARGPGLYILMVLALVGGGLVWWFNRGTPAAERNRASGDTQSAATEKPAASAPADPFTPPSEATDPIEPNLAETTPAATTPATTAATTTPATSVPRTTTPAAGEDTVAAPPPATDAASKPPKAVIVEEDPRR